MTKRIAVAGVVSWVLLAVGFPVRGAGGRTLINDRETVVLQGNVHPMARQDSDVGRAAASVPMERMILVLTLRPDRTDQLQRLLADQQDPSSPSYHRWLTPEEFGARFGRTAEEVDLVSSWLTANGLVIDEVGKGRTWINFSGTVADVERAFHTQIHEYIVEGQLHHANASDPAIPRALSGIVAGVATLHDFVSRPLHHVVGPATNLTGGAHALSPADFAAIYDLNPLYAAGVTGSGQSVAIVGRTNIKLADVRNFRSFSGLPANDPQFIINGPDPGIVSPDEEAEACLDVEWSGAVAKNATIKFVISGSTSSSGGDALSAQYIVNNNLAPVLSMSFGLCESTMGAANRTFFDNLWSQAAAQGISGFVSSMDSGASACELGGATSGTGLAVSGFCTPVNVVCVGGTQFMDSANPSAYWSPTNNPTTYASVLSYVPEQAWNESGSAAGGSGLWSTGGGASILYSKPSWQVAPGVPSDGKRDVPDVSLTAATHDGYIVFRESASPSSNFYVSGGTSASAPALAGIMALIVQKTGARQGNPNPRFYQLGNAQYTGTGPAVFHDVTVGNNSVPGVAGYPCGTGYDLATGLGSVDANALVNAWSATSGSTVTIFSDGFEGTFPGNWGVYYSRGAVSTTVWGKSSYRAASGSYSAWCAAGGSSPRPPGTTYVPNMGTWLEYGPFDLSDATAATVDFDLWSNVEAGVSSSYPDQIGLYVSTDDFNSNGAGFYYYNTGQSWQHETLDFKDVSSVPSIGSKTVYIAFIFSSDSSVQYEGSYIDNVVIKKTTQAPCSLTCSASAPTTAQVNSQVSFTGSATPSSCSGSVSYFWDFGDMTPAAGTQNATHSYSAAGTYNWQFTATVSGVSCVKNGSITVSSGGGGACGSYVLVADNDDNAWSGNPDGDWGYCLFNTDGKHPIEFHVDVTQGSISSAQLLLLCNDVDWATIANQPEVDKVYANNHYLGNLTGANDQDSTTVFDIQPSYLVAGGRNRVWINVNTDARSTPDMWCVTLKQATLLINGGCNGTASCRSVTTDKASYAPGGTVGVTVEADTTLASQQLRVEVDLVDSSGNILDGKEVDYTTSGSSNDPKSVTLTVPQALAAGTYTVKALVFDAGSGQLQSSCHASITVTGGGGCSLTCAATVPTAGTVGVPVNVSSTATTTGCTGIEYHWQFSDTTALYSGQSMSHTFTAAGVYNWNLWVHTNEQDCYKNGTITITGGGGSCTLACSATVASTAQVNQSVSFAGSATPSNCGSATVTYSWDFGDMTAMVGGQSVTHSYAVAGTYNWQMTAVVAGVYCVKNGTITVSSGGGACGGCAATRSLPGAYTPGQALQVTIQTCPPSGSNNHALEDSPPTGWTVSGIDGGGTYDSANGKVKWGPFFDTQPRTLHYSVTPPAGTTGTKTFQGVISIDGVSQAICGTSAVSAGAYHPADTGTNWRIDINEATAYGAAWKQGTTWSVPPNPIPIDYVTNAGYLWKSGEAYHYDGTRTPPWASGAPAQVFATDTAAGTREVVARGAGSAIATFGASTYSPGVPLHVSISVMPAPSTQVYAVEDAPPAGWTTSAIDNGGVFDAGTGKVKWGPFFDNASRTLGYTVTPSSADSCPKTFVGVGSFDGSSFSIAGGRTITSTVGGCAYSYWVPVVSHVDVPSKSAYYRTDTGVLNLAIVPANITVRLYTGSGVASMTSSVAANGQQIFQDIAGMLGFNTGSGAVEVRSDQPLIVTSRTYNQEQGTGKTYGQGYDGISSASALATGHSALLPQLMQSGTSGQSGTYRTNIGITNTGSTAASVTVAIFDQVGNQLWSDTRSYDPGVFYQYQEPFRIGAGRTDIARGYAKVTVNSGSGVLAYASVLDNASSDPTTINTFAAATGGAPPFVYWVPVVSHVDVPSKSAYYRSDTGLLNLASATANVTMRLYAGSSVLTMARSVSALGQEIVQDIAGLMGFTTGSGALQVSSDQPLLVTSRTYNREQGSGKTYGQGYDGIVAAQALAAGQSALLPQLVQSGVSGQVGTYRTNIGITNSGPTAASVTVMIYDSAGTQLWSDTRSYDPGAFYQYQEPFRTGAGRTDITKGYAKVLVNSGSGVIAYASVLDDGSSDPTTINMKR